MADMAASLQKYYAAEGISADDFRCQRCGLDPSEWSCGSAAYLGEDYPDTGPRIAFLSLDRAHGAYGLAQRRQEMDCVIARSTSKKCLNAHLRGTLETLNLLLRKDMSCRERKDFRRMALVNSAKCSRKGTADQAPEKVFEKCARYLLPELDILKPGILVVQGKWAWMSLETTLGCEKLKKVDRHTVERFARARAINPDDRERALDYNDQEAIVWEAEIGTSRVAVLKTIHPSARGKHRKKWTCFRDEILPTLSRIVVALATREMPS